jgi:hypothetical protein
MGVEMAKHTITGWITMSVPDPDIFEEQSRVGFMPYKPTGEYNVAVREHSIEVEVPDDFDIRPAAVAAIDKQIADKRAELTKEITELMERKNRLLCIENAS